uniref:Cilia- and flagella-associated protein 157 n=1 Tax=Noctiluca scintillans TaxID=2966 RepID=A0A7S1AFM0_NOCSC
MAQASRMYSKVEFLGATSVGVTPMRSHHSSSSSTLPGHGWQDKLERETKTHFADMGLLVKTVRNEVRTLATSTKEQFLAFQKQIVDLQDRFQGVLMEQENSRVLDEIREENNRVRDRADIDNRFATLRSSVEEVRGVYDMQLENLEEHVKTLRDETNETALKFAAVELRLNELRAHVFVGQEQDGECRDSLRLLSKRIDVQTVACLALHRRIDNKQALSSCGEAQGLDLQCTCARVPGSQSLRVLPVAGLLLLVFAWARPIG